MNDDRTVFAWKHLESVNQLIYFYIGFQNRILLDINIIWSVIQPTGDSGKKLADAIDFFIYILLQNYYLLQKKKK